jgi:hypothetical protein
MRLGINLRGDLAKLNDAEIASRYNVLLAEKMAQHEANPPQVLGSKCVYRLGSALVLRGPFHARIFYKAQIVALNILHIIYNEPGIDPEAYLRGCELKDVTDEIQRHIRRRPKSAAASVTP